MIRGQTVFEELISCRPNERTLAEANPNMATNNINTGNCPKEETVSDAYQITNRKRYHWDLDYPHFESMRKAERIDVRNGQVHMGHHRTLRDTKTSAARLQQKKDMASGSSATAEDNNVEWASSPLSTSRAYSGRIHCRFQWGTNSS